MEEQRAYQFGLVSIGFFLIATILGTFGLLSVTISSGISLASLAMAVAALINGRKELAADSKNKKSKIGLIIGIVMLSLQLLAGVVVIFWLMA